MLVAGDRGLGESLFWNCKVSPFYRLTDLTGKTTFINTIFEPPTDPLTKRSFEEPKGRTTIFRAHNAVLKDAQFRLDLTIIDTPGFFDTANDKFCWVPITNYIDEQYRLSCFQEEQPNRSEKADGRVHACVYFLTPTPDGVTESDIVSMQQLCTRVNLIPVISKADTFTSQQIVNFKMLARKAFEDNNINVCGLVSDQAKVDIGEIEFPLSIIGSESYVTKSDGQTVRGRAYSWGIAEVENDQHCEFNALKDLLMISHTIDLIEGTEAYHEMYRYQMMRFRVQETIKKQLVEQGICEELESAFDENSLEKLKMAEEDRIIQTTFEHDDSIDCLLKVSSVTRDSVEEVLAEQNPIFIEHQQKIKRNFHSIVIAQERKFKDWKHALANKQKAFNSEILHLQQDLAELEEACDFFYAELNGTVSSARSQE